MTSREACQHRIARISAELYHAALRLEGSLSPEMSAQLEASTMSIGSNWLESHGRAGTPKGGSQFLRFARGSAYEAAFQFLCAGEDDLAELAHEVCALLDAELDEAERLTDKRSLLFTRKPSKEEPEA